MHNSFASTMLLHLNSLISQFKFFGNTKPFSKHLTNNIDFAAMQSIVYRWNFPFDDVSIDGIFNLDTNLPAFAAGTKNNSDILSQAKMLQSSNQDKFLQ
jgi:hypothetical protein